MTRDRKRCAVVLSLILLLAGRVGVVRAMQGMQHPRASSFGMPADSLLSTRWSSSFAPTGADSIVFASTVFESQLVIGGVFRRVGLSPARGVATWDGTDWLTLGEGLPGEVHALAEWNGILVAGGTFTRAMGAPGNYLVWWDGTDWQPFAQELDDSVLTLSQYRGQLVAGGTFAHGGATTCSAIAAWNGTAWTDLGGGVSKPSGFEQVRSVLALRDTLYVAGDFSTAGGVANPNIAAWTGSAWNSVGGGTSFPASCMVEFDGSLVAGGEFGWAGGVPCNCVATWRAGIWSSLSGGLNNIVQALQVYRGRLVAAGYFYESVSGVSMLHIGQWDGATWSPMTSGIGKNYLGLHEMAIPALQVYNDELVVGGYFADAGLLQSENLVAWNDTTWRSITPGNGLSSDVMALCAYRGSLIVGGYFSTAGSTWAPQIAAWDGAQYAPLGVGMTGLMVSALQALGESLAVGGSFSAAGGVAASNIAIWDGSGFRALGSGLNGTVNALVVWQGHLFAGGAFTQSGSQTVSHVAAWTGTRWIGVGGGVDDEVYALAVYRDALVVGGRFTHAGSLPASGVARWDGVRWTRLLTGVANTSGAPAIRALTVLGDSLVAGGSFTSAGGVSAPYVAVWNGAEWGSLGEGIAGTSTPRVSSLCTDSDRRLYCGGTFAAAGGVACSNIAQWTPTGGWEALGGGLHMASGSGVAAALQPYRGSIYVGGDQLLADGLASWGLSRWDGSLHVTAAPAPVPRSPAAGVLLLAPRRLTPRRVLIEFRVTAAETVHIWIADARGGCVCDLGQRRYTSGSHAVRWAGTSSDGRATAAGVYFVLATTARGTASRRFVQGGR